MLKFSPANTKLVALRNVPELERYLANKRKVYSFDLLSGHSCPFAHNCLSKVEENNGKLSIHDGKATEFRCFSASQEVIFRKAYESRKRNFDNLRGKPYDDLCQAIKWNIPCNAGIIRIHVAGDFFSRAYFDAWCWNAKRNPDLLFYAYTKSLSYWVNAQDIPENMVLTASFGGRLDNLIAQHGLRYSKVVYSPEQATELGLDIDHTDEFAANPTLREKSFALLLHGVQPAKSEASVALQKMKRAGVNFSYRKG